jgi:hypothetical protein
MNTAEHGPHPGRTSRLRAVSIASMVAACASSLALAASASATPTVTVGIAPISSASGSFVLTLTNTGGEAITDFIVAPGETTNADPTSCVANTLAVGALDCHTTIAPSASFQVCYTGSEGHGGELGEFVPGSNIFINTEHVHVTAEKLGAVSTCPVAGFKTGTTTPPPTGSPPPTGAGTPPPTGAGPAPSNPSAKCVVPKLKGKTLARAEKALTKAHCKVGKIKRVKSAHAKQGTVVAQGTPAGKSLAGGAKVALTESKGK